MDTTEATNGKIFANPDAKPLGMDENQADQQLPAADSNAQASAENQQQADGQNAEPSADQNQQQNQPQPGRRGRRNQAANGQNQPEIPRPKAPRKGELVIFCPYHPNTRL